MNIVEKAVVVLCMAAVLVLCGQQSLHAYQISDMVLRDSAGNPIAAGSKTPYSPKQTCGTVGCHIDMARSFGMSSGNVYESEIAYAVKDHGPGFSAYSVPYPLHGVSAGYHFQGGRNVSWGVTQRNYYGDVAFASSPGIFGGYCPSYNRQLADLDELSSSLFDLGAYEFGHSECGWCHSGGPQEYDREGFRYDGSAGLFQPGPNLVPKKGDYFTYDPSTDGLADRTTDWQSGGVAEVDCFLCHLNMDGVRYGLTERNFAISETGQPGLAASLGLAGGHLSIAQRAGDGVNPDISQAGWSWTSTALDHGVIVSPLKENCALCHAADKSQMEAGPAGVPLGYTSFQKVLPVGTADDGDVVAGGRNSVAWKTARPRADAATRGVSINDPQNPDLHVEGSKAMQCTTCHYILGTSRDYDTDCLYCHYEMWGYPEPPAVTPVLPTPFAALTDTAGATIQPAVGVFRIDHQFAKGDSSPNRNMDQLDNTVSCRACHIDRTHPNQTGAPNPDADHANTTMPASHFEKISCEACHITVMNGPVGREFADFTAGPYQTFARTAADAPGARRPLYLWRRTVGGLMEIEPFGIVSSAGWADAVSQSADQAVQTAPVFPRIARKAAEGLRSFYGDADGNGVYDWTLNRPQNGDTTLIVNTAAEISDFIARLGAVPGGPANPVMHFAFDRYSLSHHVRPLHDTAYPPLGSLTGGGCLMCHASSDPQSPYYSSYAVGFFDGSYELFPLPQDGGSGLVQTSLPAQAPLSGSLRRVDARFPYATADGTPSFADLSNGIGQSVGNRVNQGEVLGYDAGRRAALMNPAGISFTISAGAGANGAISPSGEVSVLGGTSQTFTIAPDAGYRIADVLVDGTSVGALSSYTFYGLAAAHTISVTFTANVYVITATADAHGSITPAGTVSVNAGASQTFQIAPDPGYEVLSVIVDGSSKGAVTSYTFSNVSADHAISAYFRTTTYTITSSAGAGGSISPLGTSIVATGADQAFTITPSAGYHIASVTVDGASMGAVSSYTFANVTANHTIAAAFAANSTFTITAAASGSGTISPSGAVSVRAGANQKFTFTPAAGYRVSEVRVDGASIGARTSYTFYSVQADHTISVTFVLDVFTITATAYTGGTIAPAGTTTISRGGSQTYVITPDPGRQVSGVIVDGSQKGAITSYTFTNVTANHTINAYFK